MNENLILAIMEYLNDNQLIGVNKVYKLEDDKVLHIWWGKHGWEWQEFEVEELPKSVVDQWVVEFTCPNCKCENVITSPIHPGGKMDVNCYECGAHIIVIVDVVKEVKEEQGHSHTAVGYYARQYCSATDEMFDPSCPRCGRRFSLIDSCGTGSTWSLHRCSKCGQLVAWGREIPQSIKDDTEIIVISTMSFR